MTSFERMKGLAVLAAALFLCAVGAPQRQVMPWMCLERCGENVDADLGQLLAIGSETVGAVSIEAYDLVYGAHIKDCGYARVGPKLRDAGFEVYPMITTANIAKLRDLWLAPDQFIDEALAVAAANDWITGFNVDFEPEGGDPPTQDDAQRYVAFLDAFARRLHAKGFRLTVDIANWSVFWNNTALARTAVDRFMMMDTYVGNITRFESLVSSRVASFGVDHLGVGLETLPSYTPDDIRARFDIIRRYGVYNVDIWMTPIPETWVPIIRDFVAGK